MHCRLQAGYLGQTCQPEMAVQKADAEQQGCFATRSIAGADVRLLSCHLASKLPPLSPALHCLCHLQQQTHSWTWLEGQVTYGIHFDIEDEPVIQRRNDINSGMQRV